MEAKASSFLRDYEEAKKGRVSPGALAASHSKGSLGPMMGGSTTHMILLLALWVLSSSYWRFVELLWLGRSRLNWVSVGVEPAAGSVPARQVAPWHRSQYNPVLLFTWLMLCLFSICLLLVQLYSGTPGSTAPTPCFCCSVDGCCASFVFLLVWFFVFVVVYLLLVSGSYGDISQVEEATPVSMSHRFVSILDLLLFALFNWSWTRTPGPAWLSPSRPLAAQVVWAYPKVT